MCSRLIVLFFLSACTSQLLRANEYCHPESSSSKPMETEPDSKKSSSEETKNEDSNEETPLKLGNLSLRPSQQPAPLVGFGETVIEKGQVQLFLLASHYKIKNGYYNDVGPAVIYAFSDNCSLYANLPVAARYKEEKEHSAGLVDTYVQLEYAYYNKSRLTYTEQATVIAGVTIPTGSTSKSPSTGDGSPSYFVGGNFNHMGIDWFYFGSLGVFLTTFHSNTKPADAYLYQVGIGRNIASPPGWIIAWMVEFDGIYTSRDIDQGEADPDSGGNILFFTPSLWISSEKCVFQLGAGGVMTQHFYGDQNHFTHQFLFNFAYTF